MRGKCERKGTRSAGYIRNTKLRQELKVIESSDDRKEKIARIYKVIGVYRYLVLTVNSFGIRRCFNYGQLVQMGMEE